MLLYSLHVQQAQTEYAWLVSDQALLQSSPTLKDAISPQRILLRHMGLPLVNWAHTAQVKGKKLCAESQLEKNGQACVFHLSPFLSHHTGMDEVCVQPREKGLPIQHSQTSHLTSFSMTSWDSEGPQMIFRMGMACLSGSLGLGSLKSVPSWTS